MATAVISLLDSYLASPEALSFIINSYLVAVGYRPLYSVDIRDESQLNELIRRVAPVFPSLTFTGALVHNVYWTPNYKTHREMGTLLNYPESIDIQSSTSEKNLLLLWALYKNVKIPLNQHLVLGTTQVSQLTNRLIELRLLLKPLNVLPSMELDSFQPS